MSKELATSDYASLQQVLVDALVQSAHGKGKERHANGRAFDRQPIMEISRMVGSGFAVGQVMKKSQEAHSMGERGELEAAVHELLGAVVYASAAIILLRERME